MPNEVKPELQKLYVRKMCSLPNAVTGKIGGNFFCLSHFGMKEYKNAPQICNNSNSSLPIPRSFIELHDLIETLKRVDFYPNNQTYPNVVLGVKFSPKLFKGNIEQDFSVVLSLTVGFKYKGPPVEGTFGLSQQKFFLGFFRYLSRNIHTHTFSRVK